MEIGTLKIHLAATADGQGTYVQIASPAAMPVNIVLIAARVELDDQRPGHPPQLQGEDEDGRCLACSHAIDQHLRTGCAGDCSCLIRLAT